MTCDVLIHVQLLLIVVVFSHLLKTHEIHVLFSLVKIATKRSNKLENLSQCYRTAKPT